MSGKKMVYPFEGMQFTFVGRSRKEHLQLIVERLGGRFTQLDNNKAIVIAMKDAKPSVFNKLKNRTIVSESWLADCGEAGRALPFNAYRITADVGAVTQEPSQVAGTNNADEDSAPAPAPAATAPKGGKAASAAAAKDDEDDDENDNDKTESEGEEASKKQQQQQPQRARAASTSSKTSKASTKESSKPSKEKPGKDKAGKDKATAKDKSAKSAAATAAQADDAGKAASESDAEEVDRLILDYAKECVDAGHDVNEAYVWSYAVENHNFLEGRWKGEAIRDRYQQLKEAKAKSGKKASPGGAAATKGVSPGASGAKQTKPASGEKPTGAAKKPEPAPEEDEEEEDDDEDEDDEPDERRKTKVSARTPGAAAGKSKTTPATGRTVKRAATPAAEATITTTTADEKKKSAVKAPAAETTKAKESAAAESESESGSSSSSSDDEEPAKAKTKAKTGTATTTKKANAAKRPAPAATTTTTTTTTSEAKRAAVASPARSHAAASTAMSVVDGNSTTTRKRRSRSANFSAYEDAVILDWAETRYKKWNFNMDSWRALEATGRLPSRSARQIADRFKNLHKQRGGDLHLTPHDLEQLEKAVGVTEEVAERSLAAAADAATTTSSKTVVAGASTADSRVRTISHMIRRLMERNDRPDLATAVAALLWTSCDEVAARRLLNEGFRTNDADLWSPAFDEMLRETRDEEVDRPIGAIKRRREFLGLATVSAGGGGGQSQ